MKRENEMLCMNCYKTYIQDYPSQTCNCHPVIPNAVPYDRSKYGQSYQNPEVERQQTIQENDLKIKYYLSQLIP